MCLFSQNINGLEKSKTPFDTIPVFVDDVHFKQAYDEIERILDGKDSMNFKRASFLVEWAYLDGSLDYNKFCSDIDSVTTSLKSFIRARGLSQYKTAGNFALFEYFTKPNVLNGEKPFKYDFEDFTGAEDFRKTFVTKLMETHTGQCRSLPVYYKILSEELGAESIKNKVYLDALSTKESVALLLTDLAIAYQKKYGYDYFTLACCDKVIEHYPHYRPPCL